MEYFNKSTLIISLIIIILIAGIGVIKFAGIDVPYLSWIQRGIYNLFSPLIEYTTALCNSVERYWKGITSISKIMEENKELKEKIYELERAKMYYYKISNENKRLRELLAFKKLVPYKTLGANVIGYSTNHWDNKIIINRGQRDGVKPKMPVISYNGSLVGKIEYVGATTSRVLLVNDPEFIAGGIVQRSDSRAIGLVKGQLENKTVNIMDNISWNKKSAEGDIREGDIIVTSGLSNSFPKGLPIGRVIKVEKDNYGLSQRAKISLFMSLKTLEEVLIITDF